MGCRVMRVQPGSIETLLRNGSDGFSPIDVPADLQVLSVRTNFSAVHPVIEVLVKSEKFDGSDSDTFEQAKSWTATFNRKAPGRAPGSKDAKR